MISRHTRTLIAAAALAVGAPAAHAALAYALADFGRTLITFDTATPGVVTTVGPISGATFSLSGLDFRPSDGKLYGYDPFGSGVFFTVDPATGVATLASTLSGAPSTTNILGMDFNPAADRLRLVDVNEANLRVNVGTGVATVDGTLAYAAGDTNAGADPLIVAAAYTNSDTNPATGTTLYYLDAALNTLVTTTNPNGGVLNTVGGLGVDFDFASHFDIFTDLGLNSAFAALRVGSANGLYSINLSTGAATLIGAIGNTSFLTGFAVVPGRLPEPGSLALLGVAGLMALAARRRKSERA